MSEEPTKPLPRPSWKHYSPEKQRYLEQRREWEMRSRATAKRLAKLEGFHEAHREQAANFFRDKLDLINGYIQSVRDEHGDIDPKKVAQLDPKVAKLVFDEIHRVEKTAGFAGVAKTEHTHTHSIGLAEELKQLQQARQEELEEIVDADVVGEE